MVKLNNKGFSLVEIIIAVAVFSILVFPITNAIVTSTKTSTRSTKKQYAVEKAEQIMETFKTAELGDEVHVTDDGKDYTFKAKKADIDTGTLDFSSIVSGLKVDYTTTKYTCENGIGDSYKNYNCTVTVNDAAYQVMKKGYVLEYDEDGNPSLKMDGSSPLKTTSATGAIRQLQDGDGSRKALIASATYSENSEQSSLDNEAYQYFQDIKKSELQKYDVWAAQLSAGAPIFDNDYFEKNTVIELTKSSKGYTVTCRVQYIDHTSINVLKSSYEKVTDSYKTNSSLFYDVTGKDYSNVYEPTTAYGDGIVYQQTFEDEIPPVYLLYVPAVYNGVYCADDYITIDNSGIKDEAGKANVYIFESMSLANMDENLKAEYEAVIKSQFGVDASKLTYVNTSSSRAKEDVNVRLKLKSSEPSSDKDKLNIFANFSMDNSNSDYEVKGTSEDESNSVYLYDISVTLTDSNGDDTTVTGTRGK